MYLFIVLFLITVFVCIVRFKLKIPVFGHCYIFLFKDIQSGLKLVSKTFGEFGQFYLGNNKCYIVSDIKNIKLILKHNNFNNRPSFYKFERIFGSRQNSIAFSDYNISRHEKIKQHVTYCIKNIDVVFDVCLFELLSNKHTLPEFISNIFVRLFTNSILNNTELKIYSNNSTLLFDLLNKSVISDINKNFKIIDYFYFKQIDMCVKNIRSIVEKLNHNFIDIHALEDILGGSSAVYTLITKTKGLNKSFNEAVVYLNSPLVPRVAQKDVFIKNVYIKKDSLIFFNTEHLSCKNFLYFGAGKRGCMGQHILKILYEKINETKVLLNTI